MNDQVKKEIVSAAKQYMDAKGISQNALAKATQINVAYLSAMLKGELTLMVGDKPTQIQDKWFTALAEYVGFVIVKSNWNVQLTPQYVTMITLLEDAKLHPQAMLIVGDTGIGKTYSIDKFCNENPVQTFRITVADHYKLKDVLNEICTQVGVPTVGLSFDKLYRLQVKLIEMRRSGGNPVIIIDEAENLKTAVLRMFKAMYDKFVGSCSIVLIGTEDIQRQIDAGVIRGVSGMPQFKRRFKAGTRFLPGIDRSFKQFLNAFNFEPGLNKLLVRLANNYGELHDYITPALREADRLGQPLTEDLFRTIFNMPKPKGGQNAA